MLLIKIFKDIIFSHIILRRLILLGLDALLISISFTASNFFLKNNFLDNEYFFYRIFLFLSIGLLVFIFTGQYKAISLYVEGTLFYRSILRNSLLIIIFFLISIIDKRLFLDTENLLLICFFLTSLVVSSRLVLRDLLHRLNVSKKFTPKVIIFGAGNAGAQLAYSIKISGKYKILGFIDDDPSLNGRELYGIKICPFNQIEKFKNVEHVLFAIPSLNKNEKRKIINSLKFLNFDVLQIPSLNDITSGKVRIDKLKPVELEDLLGRDKVLPDKSLLGSRFSELVVCVTGGGGSIGSELCRQIVLLKVKKVLLIDNCEHHLYELYQELKEISDMSIDVIPILGDVTNKEFVNEFMTKFKVDLIFHAAAYKHVPMVEKNPISGLINNVLSTYILCSSAKKNNVKQFIFISSDKAVRPTNVMGASKRLSEMIVQAFADDENKSTIRNRKYVKFSMVRFGNVLGSSGSVIPLFKKQIQNGGPVTITHREITRFFMTIEEAVELVLQSVSLAENGDLLLLDMGEPVKIKYLAEQLIRLSGLTVKDKTNPKGDIEIIYTGLRSGEKLYEELLIDANSEKTEHPLIFKAKEPFLYLDELVPKIHLLEKYLYAEDKNSSFKLLAEIVPEWKQNL